MTFSCFETCICSASVPSFRRSNNATNQAAAPLLTHVGILAWASRHSSPESRLQHHHVHYRELCNDSQPPNTAAKTELQFACTCVPQRHSSLGRTCAAGWFNFQNKSFPIGKPELKNLTHCADRETAITLLGTLRPASFIPQSRTM